MFKQLGNVITFKEYSSTFYILWKCPKLSYKKTFISICQDSNKLKTELKVCT